MRHESETLYQYTQQGHLGLFPINAPGLHMSVDCPLPLQQHMAHYSAQQCYQFAAQKLRSLRSFHMQSKPEALNLQE